MSDKLIIQSISGNKDDRFKPWMAVTEPIHREYCERHDADYELFVGDKEHGVHPTWNRLPMFLDAFSAGYKKVAWLDADTVIINQERDFFEETDDEAPMLMTRVLSSHHEFPWASRDELGNVVPADKWDVYNDGVLIANNTEHARKCFEFAWANRKTKFEPWHVPGIPELDWILDYVYEHPESVLQLDLAYNWMPYPEACPRDQAVILAWHGGPHPSRWAGLREAMQDFYGVDIGKHPFKD